MGNPKREVTVYFGKDYPPIEEQLKKQSLTLGTLDKSYELIRSAIDVLYEFEIMSDKDVTKAYNNLITRMKRDVRRVWRIGGKK